MQGQRWKAWAAGLLILASLAPWLLRSDVERLVVMQKHVLLGRYAAGWFMVLAFAITPGCLLGAWALWRSRTVPHRQILFRLVALGFAFLLGFGLVDTVARMMRKPSYVVTGAAGLPEWPIDQQAGEILHRRPNERHELVYDDLPAAARSYPGRPRGYPRLEMTLTIDARGFRNPTALAQADLLVVGDSFVEGCLVGDDQALPVLLGRALGSSVYNLGMSGADPQYERDVLRGLGLGLAPKTVVLVMYEDNDFDGVRESGTSAPGGGLGAFFASSPVLEGVANAVIAWLGPIGADAPLRDFEAISSWMPLRIRGPAGEATYALKPKRLMQLATPRATFEASHGWTSTLPILRDIAAACRGAGARLLVALVPSKPRVLLPHVWAAVTPAGLHAFVSKRRALPADPESFHAALHANWTHREDALRAFCQAEGLELLSLAPALTEAAGRGEQVYYAYDQHWSPIGHAVAARTLAEHLRAQ